MLCKVVRKILKTTKITNLGNALERNYCEPTLIVIILFSNSKTVFMFWTEKIIFMIHFWTSKWKNIFCKKNFKLGLQRWILKQKCYQSEGKTSPNSPKKSDVDVGITSPSGSPCNFVLGSFSQLFFLITINVLCTHFAFTNFLQLLCNFSGFFSFDAFVRMIGNNLNFVCQTGKQLFRPGPGPDRTYRWAKLRLVWPDWAIFESTWQQMSLKK